MIKKPRVRSRTANIDADQKRVVFFESGGQMIFTCCLSGDAVLRNKQRCVTKKIDQLGAAKRGPVTAKKGGIEKEELFGNEKTAAKKTVDTE